MDSMMMDMMSKDMSKAGLSTMDMQLMQDCMDACSACEQACTVLCSTQMMDSRPVLHELRRHVQHDDAHDAADAGRDATGHDVDARRLHGDVPAVHGRVHGARGHERGLQDVRQACKACMDACMALKDSMMKMA